MFENEEKGLFATAMSTVKGLLHAADKGVSVTNEVLGTAEGLAKTARVLVEQNHDYVTTKGKATHQARMDDLNARIEANKLANEAKLAAQQLAIAKAKLSAEAAAKAAEKPSAKAKADAEKAAKDADEAADAAFGDK